MNGNHLNEEQLILYHYGEEEYRERGVRRAADEHLERCAECRANYERLEQLLAAVNALPVPDRGEEYGGEVWRRLRPRLKFEPEARAERSWGRWLAPQRWAVAGAVAALLLAAFIAGRYWPPHGPQSAGIPEAARERILLVAVGEHLERSQMVLVELTNESAKGKVDISTEQRMASELVGANRLYRQTALNTGEAGVASVLDQLERVLVEIANSPTEISSKEMESLRKRIEAQGILFKVRVIGTQVRERTRPGPAAPSPRSAPGEPRKTT